jgi:hypothetical protein
MYLDIGLRSTIRVGGAPLELTVPNITIIFIQNIMVLKTSFMKTNFCLALSKSFRNLVEQYMELKQEEKLNVKETNQIVLAGYMNINPRQKAIENYSSQILHHSYTNPFVTSINYVAISPGLGSLPLIIVLHLFTF